MAKESIYPEYVDPNAGDPPITADEKHEIALAIVKGWDDGDITENSSLHSRVKYGVVNAQNIDEERRAVIRLKLFKIEPIDAMLFQEKRQLSHEINTLMSTWPQPKTKIELNNALTGDYHIPKAKFFTKFSDHRCQKIGSTWEEFVATYPTPVEPPPPVEE
jgi:hypothetical protein